MTLRVCVAGATGWTGRAVAEGVVAADDMVLVAGTSRSAAGRDLGVAWGGEEMGVPTVASVEEALALDVDVLVDYTSHEVVADNIRTAVEAGVSVVVGTSGLTGEEFEVTDGMAREAGVGVIAAGNFSLTAAMMQAAALLVAPFLPHREVIDYASATKADSPSGTARELAERLGAVRAAELARPVEKTGGMVEARGASVAGTQVHSLRLPSFTVSTEVVFALPDERLSIRHDAGGSAAPYVAGTLLAVRRVDGVIGVVRGLDTLLLS